MMRLLVIGGLGHLGTRVVRALRKDHGAELTIASRTPFAAGIVRFDHALPETFGALDGFDLILDTSDSLSAQPDQAYTYALTRGKVVVCASADPETIERLLDRFHHKPLSGTLILGAGLSPGLSNLLAARAASAVPAGELRAITLGARVNILSQAGQGMVRQLPRALQLPSVSYSRDTRQTREQLLAGPRIPYLRARRAASLSFPLAEPPMLRASTTASEVHAYLSPSPAPLRHALRWSPGWLLRNPLSHLVIFFWLTLIRRILLTWREGVVELTATAIAADGTQRRAMLSFERGARSAGTAVAAIAILCQRYPPPPGGYTVDELFGLEQVLPIMRRDGALRARYRPPELIQNARS